MTDGVKLSQLIALSSRRGNHLANETGLFILLQATEAMRDAPVDVAVDALQVTPEGWVLLPEHAQKSDESAAIRSLLPIAEAVVNPMPSAMTAVLERAKSGKISTVGALRAEIESLLVPLNRSAARRVLGRLAREIQRSNSETLAPNDEPLASIDSAPPKRAPSDPVNHTNPGRITLDPGVDYVPPFPRPPLLGSIAKLPSGAHATDTEPDGVILGESEREPYATDTQPDGDMRSSEMPSDAAMTVPDGPTLRVRRSRWILLLAFIGFALLTSRWWAPAASSLLGPSHDAPRR